MTEVDSYLNKLVKQLTIEPSRKDAINISFEVLKGKIWSEYQDRLKAVEVFGSYDRGTALPQSVDEKSDVDVLAIFKTNDFNPTTLLKQLLKFADTNYSRSDVTTDHPTVVIEMTKVRFEIVPAYWETYLFGSNELKIPAPRNKDLKWITTAPQKLKADLKEKNAKENALITPLIKLIKYLNVINGRPYDSFAIENFITSCDYHRGTLKDYFLQAIDKMSTENSSEEEKVFVNKLKKHRANLITLLNGNMNNYAIQELKIFLPLVQS